MTRVRVMSFNIFNTTPESEVVYVSDVWANRAEFNVKTIQRYDPDLIGFQEFEPIHRTTYAENLTGYEQYISNETGEGTAIYWRSERFEAVDAGHLWLAQVLWTAITPPGMAILWNPAPSTVSTAKSILHWNGAISFSGG